MQSLLQAKHRQTSITKCFRYSFYITGSHFGERFTDIAKIGGGNWYMPNQKRSDKKEMVGGGGGRQIPQWVPKPKESVPFQ